MSKEDLLILLEPDNTLFEFILRANMSVDMFWDFNRLAAKKYFLAKSRSLIVIFWLYRYAKLKTAVYSIYTYLIIFLLYWPRI